MKTRKHKLVVLCQTYQLPSLGDPNYLKIYENKDPSQHNLCFNKDYNVNGYTKKNHLKAQHYSDKQRHSHKN